MSKFSDKLDILTMITTERPDTFVLYFFTIVPALISFYLATLPESIGQQKMV